jgi:hypothetical protein
VHGLFELGEAWGDFDASFEDTTVAQRMSGLSREELCTNSKRRGTVAVKEAVIALGRRGGIRGRELAAALGARPISSHKTILIASGAESSFDSTGLASCTGSVTRLSSSQAALKASMASSPPQNSCEFIATSYPY